jgi:hypothetical protein
VPVNTHTYWHRARAHVMHSQVTWGKKTVFWLTFGLKRIILPRQARDKQRDETLKGHVVNSQNKVSKPGYTALHIRIGKSVHDNEKVQTYSRIAM